MRPSLIIGIGGTGMAIGYALKYFIHKLLLDKERSNFKFVFIDNDKNQFNDFRTKFISEVGDFKNEIIKITDFYPFDVYQKVKAKEEKNKPLEKVYNDLYNWFDPAVTIKPQIYDEGLAANRMIGRMCGYVNYTKIENRISYASDQLKKIFQDANKTIDEKSLNVYIITSNSGGTGSSLFFDVSAIVDNIFNSNYLQIPKTLIFVSPNYYLNQKKAKIIEPNEPEYLNLQINSWAFIDECEYFIQNFDKDPTLMAKYFCKPSVLENQIDNGTIFSPFTSAWVFDHITSEGKKISDDKFFNSIAEILFYTLTSSSNDKFISELTVNTFIQRDKDSVKGINLNQYTTLGIKVLRYPKEEFEKYFRVRYVYEVFKKLLDRNPFEKNIEEKAKEFVSEAFTDSKNNIISKKAFSAFDEKIKTDPDTSFIRFKEEYEDNPLGLFKKEGSENFKDEVEIKGDFNKHESDLEKFRRKVEEIYQNLRRTNLIVAFSDRYRARGNASDDIREKLWGKAYDVIAELGYYGIVGVKESTYETKGYVEIIREMLINYYTQTVKEYSQTDVIISKIKNDIEDSRAEIIRKSKAVIGTKKVKTAENEINQYLKKLREYRETIIQKYYLIIKQEILYHFAVGDVTGALLKGSAFESQLASDTELTKYEKDMKLRIGTAVLADDIYRTSLLREFDDTKKDSDTIKNNYTRHLTSEFRETEKDVFTTYLPMQLVDLIDHRTEDGWKKNNELDKVFKSEIKISKYEIDRIIDGNDKEEWKIKLALLRDSKDQKKSVKNVIDEIKDRVEKYCESNYIKKSDSGIGQYLNRTIDQVMKDLNKETFNNLIQMINEVDYPINAADLASIKAAGPYFNVNPKLVNFVQQTFTPLHDTDIIPQEQIGENKIVAVLYKRGISYKNLMGNGVNLSAYNNRKLKIFRPFLNKRWNEFIRGPWEDPILKKSLGEKRIKIKIGRITKDITYKEVIAFCTSIDLLLQKSPELVKKIFITDKKIIKNDGLINRSIIHYDENFKKFVYVKEAKYDSNNKLRIREGLNKDNFVELNLSLDLNKFLEESETDRNYLKFGKSAQEIAKDRNFNDSALKNFCIALSDYKDDVKKALNKNINSLSTSFRNLAVELKKRNLDDVKIEDSDFSSADEFDETMRRLLKDFFGVK